MTGEKAQHSSSSSFIEPPATGHHQWSGAKKNIFPKNYILQYNNCDEVCVQHEWRLKMLFSTLSILCAEHREGIVTTRPGLQVIAKLS